MSNAPQFARQIDRFMRRIETGVHAKAVVMDTDRIGPFGGMILMTLADIEPAPIQTLVAALGRDKSQMTRVIKALESKGVVTRTACPTDGRVSLLRLSDKGRTFVSKVETVLSEVMDEILEPLDAAERKRLAGLLRKLG